MEQIDQVISTQIAPYLEMIEQLQQKQKEKEAEIVVLKYALLEMDRKFQELEKKTKAAPAPAARAGGRTTASTAPKTGAGATGKGSALTTPRGTSRSAQQPTSMQDARQRSKTPTSNRMQNSLNASMTSKTGVNRESVVGKGATSTTRDTSKSRNGELQSSGLKKAAVGGSQRQAKPEEKKAVGSSKAAAVDRNSRASSRQGREPSSNTSTLKKGALGAKGNTQDQSFSGRQSDVGLNQSLISENPVTHATFGKATCQMYPWEKKPSRTDPSVKPSVDLKLAYVPSYNGKNARNNIQFIDGQHIIFFSSTVGVIMNIETYQQQILTGHTDEIVCMSYQPLTKTLCTAQKAASKDKDPYFIIWDLNTNEKLVMGASYQKSIQQVAVDESGSYLITVGGTDKTSVCLWAIKDFVDEFKKDKFQAVVRGIQARAEFDLPKLNVHQIRIDTLTSHENIINIWMGTDKGVRSVQIDTKARSIQESKIQSQLTNQNNVYDIQFVDDEVYFGCEDGVVMFLAKNRQDLDSYDVDGKSVQSLGCVRRSGGNVLIVLTEESAKGSIYGYKILNEQFDLVDQEILTKLGSENLKFKPKAVCVYDEFVIIGYEQNTIIKYDLNTNQREVLISGPFFQPQYLAVHPLHKVFAIVGLDKFLRLYSYNFAGDRVKNCLINSIELQNEAKSCDFSPNGKFFCLGYQNGVFEVFQLYDNDGEYFQIECLKLFDLNRKYAVQCVKFSPDGRYLTISCHKDLVVFSAQSEDFDQEGLLKGNTQTVTFLQYDKQSQYAMTNSIDGQVLVWELISGSFAKTDPAKVKDLEWDRKCCVYTWDIQGAWTPDMKETDMNQVSISSDNQLIAVAENLGRVKVFCYPAYIPRQNFLSLDHGHVSHVIGAQFTNDDNFLITLGEQDCTVMIWAYKSVNQNSSDNSTSSPLNLQLDTKKLMKLDDQ